jgi:hypothetical protein
LAGSAAYTPPTPTRGNSSLSFTPFSFSAFPSKYFFKAFFVFFSFQPYLKGFPKEIYSLESSPKINTSSKFHVQGIRGILLQFCIENRLLFNTIHSHILFSGLKILTKTHGTRKLEFFSD